MIFKDIEIFYLIEPLSMLNEDVNIIEENA